MKKILLTAICLFLLSGTVYAQEQKTDASTPARKTIWFDPKDHYFDMSDFIINMHGFVPVPIIITEPAVGGLGAGIMPVFITPNKPVEKDGHLYPTPPDMTMAGGAYTANGTWFLAGGKIGTIEKYGLRYKLFGGYADANLDFYEHLPKLNKDARMKLNFKVIPVYGYLSKQLPDPRFTLGMDYMFANVDVSPRKGDTNIPDRFLRDFKSNMSIMGIVFEFDDRDNTFTPNKGIKATVTAKGSAEAIGSDYNYVTMEEALYWFHPVAEKWISGMRFDTQQIYGSPPFYVKPYIDMRAVPSAKYQGDYTGLVETEQRFDFGKTGRWSAVGFGGLGKAFDDMNDFTDQKWVYSFGFGGRYLLSNKLNLRVGLDFAKGRDGYAWYIVFGSSWVRQ